MLRGSKLRATSNLLPRNKLLVRATCCAGVNAALRLRLGLWDWVAGVSCGPLSSALLVKLINLFGKQYAIRLDGVETRSACRHDDNKLRRSERNTIQKKTLKRNWYCRVMRPTKLFDSLKIHFYETVCDILHEGYACICRGDTGSNWWRLTLYCPLDFNRTAFTDFVPPCVMF